MDRMTPEQAAALLSRMDGLTDALNESEDQARQTRELADETHGLATRLKWTLIGFIVASLAAGAAIWYTIDQNKQNAVASCEFGNNLREGQREWFREYFKVATASAEAQKAPQAVLDYYDDMLAWTITDTLPLRDCDDLSKPIPEPGPAPSFEDALKAALEDQGDG